MKHQMKHQSFGKVSYQWFTVFVGLTLVIFSAMISAAELKDDLVGYWPLDDDANDTIGKHDGKLVGGAKFVNDAKRGKVLSVDGKDGHVEISNAKDLNFGPPDSFTVAVWLDIQTLPSHWSGIVTKGRDTPNWYGLWVTPGNLWHFVGGQGGANVRMDVGKAKTGWLHLAGVYDANAHTQTVYEDATVVGENKGVTIAATGAGDIWFGGAKSVNEFLEARLDDVLLYKRALSEADLKKLAAGAKVLAIFPKGKLATLWAEIKQEIR